jgi:hypothetical protein
VVEEITKQEALAMKTITGITGGAQALLNII